MSKDKSTARIEDFVEEEAEPEELPRTEIPKQFEFYKVPKRFGSIPVDELPLGCDKDEQYYKIYPRVPLPFQQADRISFGHPKMEPNRLFWGDNLHVMRMLPSESIDLIYIDPPFFSGRNYNLIFGDQNEIRSFTDIWEGGMPGYQVWLNARLLEMKRLLKPKGTIFVHCDGHASHYIKVELDKIFGYDNFRNEIIWQKIRVRKAQSDQFSKLHDVILFYSKSNEYYYKQQVVDMDEKYRKSHFKLDPETGRYVQLVSFIQGGLGPPRRFGNKEIAPPPGKHWIWSQDRIDKAMKEGRIKFTSGGRPRLVRYWDESKGSTVGDIWTDIYPVNSVADERVGYPTQKPIALLERIIDSTTRESDVVADFFCGGGTTPVAAQRMGRRWIACDMSRIAVAITMDRLMANMKSTPSQMQTMLQQIPDISVEYWGIYETPSLTQLSQEEFTRFIVSAYNGRISTGGKYIHGYKSGVPLYVGPASQELPVTKDEVIEFAKEITIKRGLKRGNMLAWAFTPSAQQVADRLQADGLATLEFIKLSLVRIESEEFREHVTSKHKEYAKLLTFILPPEVRFRHKRVAPLTYEFDISESISVNPGGKIANVQWDFDFKGRFISTAGYSFVRDNKNAPVLKAKYQFDRLGKRPIACRIQDDLGGERTHIEEIAIQ